MVGFNGIANGTTIRNAGSEIVSAGGFDQRAVVFGTQTDFGSAAGDTIYFHGSQFVEAGGVASGIIVSAGGVEYVVGR